jgi:hypothetical protein
MIMAFNMLKSSSTAHNSNRYFNSHLYEYARKNLSKTMSKSQTGNGNSQYGTIWLSHSWIENLRIKIPKLLLEEYIAQGWYGPKGSSYTKLSWERKLPQKKNNTPKTLIKKPRKKSIKLTKKCPFCGTVHPKKEKCSVCNIHHTTQILKNLNKYFNLSLDNLGTLDFINDWKKCQVYGQELYSKYSASEIASRFCIRHMAINLSLKILGVKIRTHSESLKFYNKI